MDISAVIANLQKEPRLYSEHDSFSDQPGIYALFYRGSARDMAGLPLLNGELLYIGKTESSQISRDANTHFGVGRTGSSTVRRSLGALLKQELELTPIPRNGTDYPSGKRSHYKFDDSSERLLTQWMKDHVSMSFFEHTGTLDELKTLEDELIDQLVPPLNLQKNSKNPYQELLRGLRRECAAEASASFGGMTLQISTALPRNVSADTDSNKAGKYSEIWMSIAPAIKKYLRQCDIPQRIELEQRAFEAVGNRKSYSFNIMYSGGEASNNLGGSAVARDLDRVLQQDRDIQEILRGGDFKINMDSKFILWIRRV